MSFVAEERKKHTIYPPAHEVFSWTRTCDIQDVSFFYCHIRTQQAIAVIDTRKGKVFRLKIAMTH